MPMPSRSRSSRNQRLFIRASLARLGETSAPLHRYRTASFGSLTMPVSNTDIIERIARVIAGRVVSSNAEGDDPSAGDRVDSIWRDYREDALSVLRTLREP